MPRIKETLWSKLGNLMRSGGIAMIGTGFVCVFLPIDWGSIKWIWATGFAIWFTGLVTNFLTDTLKE